MNPSPFEQAASGTQAPVDYVARSGAVLSEMAAFALLLLIFTAIFLMSIFSYRHYLRVSIASAFGLASLALVAGVVVAVVNAVQSPIVRRWESTWGRPAIDGPHDVFAAVVETAQRNPIALIVAYLFVVFALPFVVKMYRGWVGGRLTDAERQPDGAGLRAWLGRGNIICTLGTSVCAWAAFDSSFWGILLLMLIAGVAYPLINMLLQLQGAAPAILPPTENLSSERERVLRLLEEGKITAEESAELLGALGDTVRPISASHRPMTRSRKFLLIGSALVLVGFFLPWFSFNLGEESSRMMSQMQMPNWAASSGQSQRVLPPSIKTGTAYISGGDVHRGIGWLILLIGLGAGALPFINSLSPTSQRTIGLIALSVGAILMLYLITAGIRHVHIGLVVVAAGYVLAFVGTLREHGITFTSRSGMVPVDTP